MTYTPKGVVTASDISVNQLSDIASNLGTVTQGDFSGALAGATGTVSNVTGTFAGQLSDATGSVDSLGGSFAGNLKLGSPIASQVIGEDGSYMGVVDLSMTLISFGPNDSAGTGYRALRVTNA